MLEVPQDSGAPSSADIPLDRYPAFGGVSRISLKQKPKVAPATLDELIAATEGDLMRLSKPQLVQVIEGVRAKAQEYKSLVSNEAGKHFSKNLAFVKQDLADGVSGILNTQKIQYNRSKRTARTAFAILLALAMGRTEAGAAVSAGVSVAVIYGWKKEDPDGFGAAMELARGLYGNVVDDTILRLLNGGDVKTHRTFYDKNGDVKSEIDEFTTPDARVAIAAKQGFKKVVEHSGTVLHRAITPEEEKRLKELGDRYVDEEIVGQARVLDDGEQE